MKTTLTNEEFIAIVKQCDTMAQAAKMCGMSFSSFKRIAVKLNVYKINQGGKNIRKEWKTTKIKTYDILHGKYPGYQTYKLKM